MWWALRRPVDVRKQLLLGWDWRLGRRFFKSRAGFFPDHEFICHLLRWCIKRTLFQSCKFFLFHVFISHFRLQDHRIEGLVCFSNASLLIFLGILLFFNWRLRALIRGQHFIWDFLDRPDGAKIVAPGWNHLVICRKYLVMLMWHLRGQILQCLCTGVTGFNLIAITDYTCWEIRGLVCEQFRHQKVFFCPLRRKHMRATTKLSLQVSCRLHRS